jgi:hypothetical protein
MTDERAGASLPRERGREPSDLARHDRPSREGQRERPGERLVLDPIPAELATEPETLGQGVPKPEFRGRPDRLGLDPRRRGAAQERLEGDLVLVDFSLRRQPTADPVRSYREMVPRQPHSTPDPDRPEEGGILA